MSDKQLLSLALTLGHCDCQTVLKREAMCRLTNILQ